MGVKALDGAHGSRPDLGGAGGVRLTLAGHPRETLRLQAINHALFHPLKEAVGQNSIGHLPSGVRLQTETWPREFINFIGHDPRFFFVEAQVDFDGSRQFDRDCVSLRRAVGYGRDNDFDCAVSIAPLGQDDGARPGVPSVFTADFVFAFPKVVKLDDEADLRIGNDHPR